MPLTALDTYSKALGPTRWLDALVQRCNNPRSCSLRLAVHLTQPACSALFAAAPVLLVNVQQVIDAERSAPEVWRGLWTQRQAKGAVPAAAGCRMRSLSCLTSPGQSCAIGWLLWAQRPPCC